MVTKVEFFTGDDGKVWCRSEGECFTLDGLGADDIHRLVDYVKRVFPASYARLCEICGASRRNVTYFRYRVLERFVRCNMGEDDHLRVDVDEGRMNLERVKCPLRGVCVDEGVVCCPTPASAMSREEQKAAVLYSKGFSVGEIARLLGKSFSTVNNQLCSVCKRLGLATRREVIGVCRNFNLL